MKNFTEEQIEMLGILPNNIAQSADFTPKAKLLLAELIFRNGMDKVADDGYFFVTNSELMEASGYGNKQVAVAINRFANLGFIERKTGKYKGNASEYILNMEKIENYESTKGVVKGCTFDEPKGVLSKGVLSNYTLSGTEEVNIDIMQLINELRSEINELKGVVSELKGVVKGCSLKGVVFEKYTTDTDTDSETDKETIYVYSENETDATDTFTEVEVTDEDTSIEVKESSPRVKLSKEEITRRNNYISKVFERLNTKLNYLYTLRTFSLYNDVCAEIANVITDAQGHREYFTEKQWDKLIWYCERFVKITEVKDNYFNGTKKKDADADVTSTDNDKNFTEKCNDGSDDSSIDNGGVRREIKPTDWAKVGEWVASSLEKYGTYTEWQKELDRILNKKFGEGWESAEYRIMAQASAIYNRCTKTAVQYYRSNETTPTPTEKQTDLAPWEMKKQDTHAEIDPTLDGYLTHSVDDSPKTPQGAPDSTSDVQPTNYPSDEIEANTEPLNEPVTNFGDTVEPDDEDMAFDDYVVMSQASRTATEYGYRYAV